MLSPEAPRPPAPVLAWDDALAKAAGCTGCVVLIGATDTGKSTFALALANRAAAEGRSVAVVDADVGQSEIGPPASVSLAYLEHPVSSLQELKPRALGFTGDITAAGHMLPLVTATGSLARHALRRGSDLVIVDTSGMVRGRLAEKLKMAKLSALGPCATLVFQRGGEAERLIRLLSAAVDGELSVIATPESVGQKSPIFRRGRRERQWRRYFSDASVHELSAGQVEVVDGWPFSGRPLPAHHVRFASQELGTEVIHAEDTADGVWFCTEARPARPGATGLRDLFKRRRLGVTPASYFNGLVVGLVTEGGRTIGLGILQGIHFSRGILSIVTPLESTARVRQLWYGRVRVRQDGTEIDRLRPGDL